MTPPSSADARIRRFHELHQSGCFVIPNPFDVGSARLLVQLGFQALATTSSGFAWTLGRCDTKATVDEVIAHARALVESVPVPVSVDFEGGYAVQPDGVGRNVSAAVKTGIAGLSIEDSTGDESKPLYEFDLAVERVRSARQAIDRSGTGVLLTARSEGYLVARPDLTETLRRLQAYAQAGADCLYAPGLRSSSDISVVVQGVAPKPVNVLVGSDFTTVASLAALGVRRISVGGALARAAWTGFLAAAEEISQRGTFTQVSAAIPFATIDGMFAAKS